MGSDVHEMNTASTALDCEDKNDPNRVSHVSVKMLDILHARQSFLKQKVIHGFKCKDSQIIFLLPKPN